MALFISLYHILLLGFIFNICIANPVKLKELLELEANPPGHDHYPIHEGASSGWHPIYIYQWLRLEGTVYQMYGLNEVHHPFGVWRKSESFGTNGEKLKEVLEKKACASGFSMANVTWRETTLHERGYEWILQWHHGCPNNPWNVIDKKKVGGEIDIRRKNVLLVEILAEMNTPVDWIYGTNVFPLWTPYKDYLFQDNFMPPHGHSVIWDSSPPKRNVFWITTWKPSDRICTEKSLFKNQILCMDHYRRGCNMPWGFCRSKFDDPRISQYIHQQISSGNPTLTHHKSPIAPR